MVGIHKVLAEHLAGAEHGGQIGVDDALEFLIAGATMVAVGTYNFVNPRAPLEVLEGIKAYMKYNKMTDIRELIGSIQR